MKMFQVAVLEVRDKALLAALSLLVGLGILFIPALLGLRDASLMEARGAGVAGIGGVTTLVVAFLLGAGMAGPDLAEGRMSFYYAKPLRPLDLWGGRLGAAWVMALLCGVLTFLPTVLLYRDWQGVRSLPGPLALSVLSCVLVGHAISIALRARTAWLILDLAGLGVAVAGSFWIAWQLSGVGAFNSLPIFFKSVAALLIAVFLLAGYLQFAIGRTDLRRGHRAQSLALAAGIAIAGLGATMFTRSVLRVDPKDVSELVFFEAGDRGPWVLATALGKPDGDPRFLPGMRMQMSFLLNTATGQGLRIPPIYNSVISKDGSRAAWVVPHISPWKEGFTIRVADLGQEKAKVWALGHNLPGTLADSPGRPMVLSLDGRKLALLREHELFVFSMESGGLLARHPVETSRGGWNHLVFLGSDRLRLYLRQADSSGMSLRILEADLLLNRLAETGSIAAGGVSQLLERDSVRDALMITVGKGASLHMEVRDGRTGGLRASLVKEGNPQAYGAMLLSDGSIAYLECEGGLLRVRHLDSTGRELERVVLEKVRPEGATMPFRWLRTFESHPGRITVSLPWQIKGRIQGNSFEIDLVTKTWSELKEGLRRTRREWSHRLDDAPARGGFAASLRLSKMGGLLREEEGGRLIHLAGPQ